MCSSFSCFAYFVVLYFICFLKKPILNFSCFNVIKDFPGGSPGKESAGNVGDLDLISGLGRSPGGGYGNPLQYSCLENPSEQRSLAGYSPRGHKESDTPERLSSKRTSSCMSFLAISTFYLVLSWLIIYSNFFVGGIPLGVGSKESACNVGDVGSIPGSGKSPGRGNGNPLQYSCLDRGAWWAIMIKLAIHNNLFFIVVIHIM